MTIAQREQSISDGQPYELYRMVYGPSSSDRALYTTAKEPVIRAGDTYTPLPIERDDIIASPGLDTAILLVRVPYDSAIAAQYRLYPPVQPVGLQIYRGHYGEAADSEILIWSGRILWCEVASDFISELECEPISTSMKRNGLRKNYQYMCPHVLYDANTCKAVKSANEFPSTVISVSGNTVVVESVGADALNPRLIGGTLEWAAGDGTYSRTVADAIVNGAETTLTLVGQTRQLNVGDPVSLYRGCGRTLLDCADSFSNAPNFGGCPYIPSENPTSKTGIFY